MKMIQRFCLMAILLPFLMYSTGCNNRSRTHTTEILSSDSSRNIRDNTLPITYNFYVENSGSVKGYFKTQTNTASVILKEFYDRIYDEKKDQDTITLNYINNQLINQNVSINTFISTIYKKCDAQYSDLDQIFETILNETNDRTVNLVMSDFCFESRTGSLPMAQSGITSIFTRARKQNKDLSIAIFKYKASFDGNYYPGKIRYKGNRPLYLWAFGSSNEIKKIADLPIRQHKEAQLFLQPFESVIPKIETKNARMTDRHNRVIFVDKWKSNRSKLYKVNIHVNLDKIILPLSVIKNPKNYSCTPPEYSIDQISKVGDGTYDFEISTKHPSPCLLQIAFAINSPTWIEKCNYEDQGIPNEWSTYGIKYLIGGVMDSYINRNKDIFDINIRLTLK